MLRGPPALCRLFPKRKVYRHDEEEEEEEEHTV
jgi:hypothetical protein